MPPDKHLPIISPNPAMDVLVMFGVIHEALLETPVSGKTGTEENFIYFVHDSHSGVPPFFVPSKTIYFLLYGGVFYMSP